MTRYLFKDCTLLTPFRKLEGACIETGDARVLSVTEKKDCSAAGYQENSYDRVIDLRGNIACPGFIDIHNHGAMGVSFMDIEDGDIEKAALHFAKGGTTSFLITPGPLPLKENLENLEKIKKVMEARYEGARAIGINMEGPYLNPGYGAQKEGQSQLPEKKEYEKIINTAVPHLKVMTVAPELPGAIDLIRALAGNGVIPAIGHTEASPADIDRAIHNGAGLITHIFNAMAHPVQKEKGVRPVGTGDYLMIRDELMAEVMADRYGAHVDPVYLKILLRVKGVENIILITDSIFPAGYREGVYEASDGRRFVVHTDDINRLEENNFLAGSVMSMNMAVKNMMQHTGIDIMDAVRMAAYNPARLLGLGNRKGIISEGSDADIVFMDSDLDVLMTLAGGKIIYDNKVL